MSAAQTTRALALRALGTLAALGGISFALATTTACGPARDAVADGSTRDGGVEPDAPYVEETCTPDADDTFCPAYADAFCAAHFACCEAADDPGIRYATMELCVQRTTCLCTARRRGAAFEEGSVTFDATGADALLARLADAVSTCPVLRLDEVELDDAFAGTHAEGADCSPDGEDFSNLFTCAPGLYCYVSDFGDETHPPAADCRRYRAEGEECDASGMTCGPGLYCGPGATIDDPGVCRAHLAGGAACLDDFECASDYCDDEAGNTCTPLEADDTWCVDAALDE